MININKNEYEYWGQWKQPILSCWFWMDWQETVSLKEANLYNIAIRPLLYLDGHFWMHRTNRDEFSKMVREIISGGDADKYANYLDSVLQKYKNEYLTLLSSTSVSNDYVSRLFEATRNMASVWIWSMFMADELGRILVEEKIVSSEEELLKRVHAITPLTWLEEQSVEVSGFVAELKLLGVKEVDSDFLENKCQHLNSRIIDHCAKFSWFGSHHWVGDGYSYEKCLEQINEGLGKSINPGERVRLVTSEESALIRLVAKGVFWRTHSAEVTAKVVFESREKLTTLAQQFGLSYEDFVYLTPSEILTQPDSLKGESLERLIQERKNGGYGCVVISDEIELVVGDFLGDLLGNMLTVDTGEVSEFRGSVASKGSVVRGVVKVIISPDDFSKMQNGDILIAPETTPDYVPLMKLASAIVTDVGGITSHAAIVARELKKPCIIGTKIATQVLKDGDLVEVDADNGVVRVLESH